MTTTPLSSATDADRRYLQTLLRQGQGVIKGLLVYNTGGWGTRKHARGIYGGGGVEVVIGSRDGNVRVLNSKGELKWSESEENEEWIGTIYCVDNLDALDKTRVIVGTRSNKVTGLSEVGEILWRYHGAEHVVRRV